MPEGKPVADFSATTTGGEVSLDDYAGKNLVLYFYPKADTPGCTRESQAFTEHYQAFQQSNTEILGVSKDSLAKQERFRDKYDMLFHLVADTDEKLCQQFDVIKEKNMYGRKYMGIERSTFLIDGDGKLHRTWRKVKVDGHAEEVLQAATRLSQK